MGQRLDFPSPWGVSQVQLCKGETGRNGDAYQCSLLEVLDCLSQERSSSFGGETLGRSLENTGRGDSLHMAPGPLSRDGTLRPAGRPSFI